MSGISKLIIFIFLIVSAFCGTSKSESNIPRIKDVTNEEKTVNSNTDLTLICEADEKITWKYPKRTEAKIDIKNSKSNGIYLSELTLKNISFTEVDYYYCHAENQAEDIERSAKVYVFVEDEENLSVLPNEEAVVVYTNQLSPVILPCRPTSTDISVKLFDHNDEELLDDTYDKHIGFTINTNTRDSQYLCKFKRDEKETILTVNVIITTEPKIYNVYKNEATLKVISGQSIYLYCFSTGVPTPTITWKKDYQQFNKGSRSRVKFSQNNAVLIISSVQNQDSGTYTCEAKNTVDTDINSVKLEITDNGNKDARNKCSKSSNNVKESTSSSISPSNPFAISTIVLGVAGVASIVTLAVKGIIKKKIPFLPDGLENIGHSIFNRLSSREEEKIPDVEKQVTANQSTTSSKTITKRTTTTYVNGEKQNTDTVVIEEDDEDSDAD